AERQNISELGFTEETSKNNFGIQEPCQQFVTSIRYVTMKKAANLPGGRWRRFAIILRPRVRILFDGPRIIQLQFFYSRVVNQGWPGYQGTTTIAVVHYSLSVIKIQDIIGIDEWIQRISFSNVWLNAPIHCAFESLGSVDTQRGRIALNLFANRSRVGSRFHQRNRIYASFGFILQSPELFNLLRESDANCGAAFSPLRLDTIEELSDLIRIAFVPNCAKRDLKN
ncbi:MAG: hypothetical protein EZS28_052781, partial [Streblomastix strix]